MWCASWRFAGLALGRSAKLRSLLGAQFRQAHGRFAGFPAWEASYAELPAGSSAGRLAGLPLGRPAKLRSLLGAQLRQAYGRFAGFPIWEVSEAELPAGSSAAPDSRVFGWPPFTRSASLGLPLKGGPSCTTSSLPYPSLSHRTPSPSVGWCVSRDRITGAAGKW